MSPGLYKTRRATMRVKFIPDEVMMRMDMRIRKAQRQFEEQNSRMRREIEAQCSAIDRSWVDEYDRLLRRQEAMTQ